MPCSRIPWFYLRCLSLPSDFLDQASGLAASGSEAIKPLKWLMRRSPLLTLQTQTLRLRPDAPWSPQKPKRKLGSPPGISD